MRTLLACLVLILAACSTTTVSLDDQQAIDVAWQALEPNTSSHNFSAWETVEVRSVASREAQDIFDGAPVPGGCVSGPTPPDNATISPDTTYWYVQLRPRRATPLPQPTEQFSPTAPPSIPEPFLYEAHMLINSTTGQITARKLYCVIY